MPHTGDSGKRMVMREKASRADFSPGGQGRTVLRVLLQLTVTGTILRVIVAWVPGLGRITGVLTPVVVIGILSVIQIFVWPFFVRSFLGIFYRISPVFMFVFFPLFSLVLFTALISAGSWISRGYFVINNFGSAFLIAVLLTVISVVFASAFSADDEFLVYRRTLKQVGRRSIKDEDVGKPGIIFLEVDGLGKKVLEHAMEKGKVPVMKRWLERGSHKLAGWTCDLSSQTSAEQAGILHGNNFDIPAFRWYDRQQKKVVVSSSMKDVAELEKKLSNGKGLMSGGGAARACLFSGDASRVLMVASRPFDLTSADLRAYYLNPSSLVRSASLMVWDWVLEKKAAWGQWLRHEEPRVSRGGRYFILRSVMTVFLRDFSMFTLKGDMYSVVPYVYATLAGYDEVSHHSGIERSDTLEVLRKLDREFGDLERIARDAPRKYSFVVLSDHGQTQGKTFSSRYGEKLEDVVKRLVSVEGKTYSVTGYETRHESAYYIDAAFKDYGISNSGIGKRVTRTLGSSQQVKVGKEGENDVVVLASGNLGLISLSFAAYRLTLEELSEMFPRLVPGLIDHPGIGLVMVRSARKGPVVLGKRGRVILTSGEVEGENPLVDYGPDGAAALVKEDGFPNAPDVLVVSTFWKDTDEVAAFEELVGSHGGIGGEQSEPFILYPVELTLGTENIRGAEAMYRVLKNWTEEIGRPDNSDG